MARQVFYAILVRLLGSYYFTFFKILFLNENINFKYLTSTFNFLKKRLLGDLNYFWNQINQKNYLNISNFLFKFLNFHFYIIVLSLYHCMALTTQNNAQLGKYFTLSNLLSWYQDFLCSEYTNFDSKLNRRSYT